MICNTVMGFYGFFESEKIIASFLIKFVSYCIDKDPQRTRWVTTPSSSTKAPSSSPWRSASALPRATRCQFANHCFSDCSKKLDHFTRGYYFPIKKMVLLFWNSRWNKRLFKLTLVSQMAGSMAQTTKREAGH